MLKVSRRPRNRLLSTVLRENVPLVNPGMGATSTCDEAKDGMNMEQAAHGHGMESQKRNGTSGWPTATYAERLSVP